MVAMITFGLVPALWAHGAGAEAIQRIAAPMRYRRPDHLNHPDPRNRPRHLQPLARASGRMGRRPRPPKKSWAELSRQFAEWERSQPG